MPFDYGPIENLKVYRKANVTEYDISKIKIPIVIHIGKNDGVAGYEVKKTCLLYF